MRRKSTQLSEMKAKAEAAQGEVQQHVQKASALKATLDGLKLQTAAGIEELLSHGPKLNEAERRRLQEMAKALRAKQTSLAKAFHWAISVVEKPQASQPDLPK